MTATGTDATLTRQLAEFAAGLPAGELPGAVVHGAKRALVDWIAAVLAGSIAPPSATLRAVVRDIAPEPVATILGTDQRTSAPFAALANGYASHLLDFDDVYNPEQTTIHLGSCVWPVVMALGQLRGLSGVDVLTAYVAGFETGARVASAAGVTHFESPWQVSGTAGRLAAAGAAVRALGLSGEAAANAFGMAAAQASGIREVYGSDTKAMQPAKAAMDGVLVGLFAERGLNSRDTALEGERGLLRAVSRDPDFSLLVDGLGTRWHLLGNGHKLYPSASLTHAAVDAAIALARTVEVARIESVECRMLPFAASVTSVVHPQPGSDAKFSTAHCVAVALLTGGLGLADFGAEAVSSPAVAALRSRIRVLPDPAVGKTGASLAITLTDGTVVRETVRHNRGTPANPLSDRDLEAKLFAVAGQRVPPAAITGIVNCCWDLDFIADLGELLAPLAIPLPVG